MKGDIRVEDDGVAAVAALLHEAGEIHHAYFSDVDGNDDDWATFYSEWLLSRSSFARLLGRTPVRSGLTRDLVQLDEEYAAGAPSEPWAAWYARRILAKYKSLAG
ncbi:MAG: hypothetical protein ACLQPV_05500 [Vulcanimicrobiaceae bacterium]